MPCAVGRQIVHTNVETHPGYQARCDRPAFESLCIAGLGREPGTEVYQLCRAHMEDLFLRGLVSRPVPVRQS